MPASTPVRLSAGRFFRTRTVVLLIIVMSAVIAGLAWWLHRPEMAEPPALSAEDINPALTGAYKRAREQVLLQPHSAAAWGMLGKVLFANQSWQPTLICCGRAAELDGAPLWIYYQAMALSSLERHSAAIDKFHQAIQLWEKRGEKVSTVRVHLASALRETGQTEQAEMQLRKALEENPSLGPAHLLLAELAYDRQDWRSCRSSLEACLTDPQVRKQACTLLPAVCLLLADKPGAAKYEQLAKRAPWDIAEIDPFSPIILHPELAQTKEHLLRLSNHMYDKRDFASSLKILGALLARYPDDYELHIARGRTLHRMGFVDAGKEMLHKAVALAPEQFQTHYILALCLSNEAQALWGKGGTDRDRARQLFEDTAAAARKAIEIKPGAGLAHALLGLSMKYLGNRELALQELRKAVQCDPEMLESHLHLGITLAEFGQAEEAELELEQARRLYPDDPRPKEELAKLKLVKR